MNILLIEDDPIKLQVLKEFVTNEYNKASLTCRMSYQSGYKTILESGFDIVLLDMQLPNYDIKSGEDGYKHRPMAGRDILKEIKRKKLSCKVIIITQYDTFGENGKVSSLQEWHNSFAADFKKNYLEIIFYKPGLSAWKNSLKALLTPFYD
jgi:DNA-binding response OmpR family regulator